MLTAPMATETAPQQKKPCPLTKPEVDLNLI